MERCAGVLCPMFSVPANQGIGDLGQKTVRMIDCIADAGYRVWQILPLQAKGRSHSPYHALSSFAGDPVYINLDRLCEMGLLTQSSITNCNKFKDRVDYETVRVFKNEYFRRAFKAFKKNYDSFKEDFEYFEKTAFWLEDWAVYQLFRSLNSERPWIEWDEEYRNYPLYKEVDLSEYEDELFYTKFLQFIFYKQFDDIVMYAHAREITLISDVAFVNYDSADVWTNRFDFLLDENGNPKALNNCTYHMPIHDFKRQLIDGFSFWKKRIRWLSRCFDVAKIDYYTIINDYLKIDEMVDYEEFKDLIHSLLIMIKHEFPGFHLIVEGLEKICDDFELGMTNVDVLLDRMKVKELKKSVRKDSVLYTSTQNHETINQAYYGYDNNHRISLRRFLKKQGYTERNFNDMICHFALDSAADICILPIWDICGYKEEARLNKPNEEDELNWTWKLKDFKNFPKDLMKTKEWIQKAGR